MIIDPHKMSHTANAVDPATNTTAASVRVDATLVGYGELMRWSKQFPERRCAVENARAASVVIWQWLVARDEVEFDVTMPLWTGHRAELQGNRRARQLAVRRNLAVSSSDGRTT